VNELPPDPDLDHLPDELAAAEGPLLIRGVDPVTGEEYEQAISKEGLGAAFADRRRLDVGGAQRVRRLRDRVDRWLSGPHLTRLRRGHTLRLPARP
jgi:hypothetical protein